MKRQFLPYYISRAVLSGVFGMLVAGLTWKAIVVALVVFGLFILYLHGGWFAVDTRNPLFPLRRDRRGQLIQRKALITALLISLVTYLLLSLSPSWAASAGSVALALAVVTYFASQFALFSRA